MRVFDLLVAPHRGKVLALAAEKLFCQAADRLDVEQGAVRVEQYCADRHRIINAVGWTEVYAFKK
jgi:hypothetical protein